MKLVIEKRCVYGNEMYYPACDTSSQFCLLLGTKTLTKDKLKIIKDMGLTISLKTEELNL